MSISLQSTQFEMQLKLTATWCVTRIDTDNPRTCLRSAELRPDLESLQLKDDDIWIYPQLVEQVISKRQSHFASAAISSVTELNLQSRGRLLLAAQDYSNHNNLTSDLTGGFFDYNDVPPWDTWITLIDGDKEGMTMGVWGGNWPPTINSIFGNFDLMHQILVSWIPSEFEALVDEAMKSEAIGMLVWADDLPEEHGGAPNFRRVVPRWFQEFANGLKVK